MVDYDLPMIESDLKEMKQQRFIQLDKEQNQLVDYVALLKELAPKKKA